MKILPPKFIYEPVPIFRTEKERYDYRLREFGRWINGHAGLTGPHYFYMQECKLLLQDGSLIRPFWRDVDSLIFEAIDKAMKNNKSLFITKRREVGLSSIGSAMMHYFARVKKGSTSAMTSKDQGTMYKIFTDKILPMQDSFHMDIRGTYDSKKGGNLNKTKSNVGLNIAMKSFDDEGNEMVRVSELFCRETSESDEASKKLSGTRAMYTFIDEAPLHKRLPQVMQSVTPALMKGTKQTGFLLLGGTIEDGIKPENLQIITDMIDDAPHINLDTLFVSACWGMDEFMTNGHSDTKGATEWVLRKREEYGRAKDKSVLKSFIKNYPLSIEELYALSGGGRFEEDVADKIKVQLKAVEAEAAATVTVRLVDNGNGIETLGTNGNVQIIEQPKPGIDYFIGIDGVATGTEQTEEGSDAASIVVKGFDPSGGSYAPVCIYVERPKSVEQSYITMVNQAKYYNQFGGLRVIEPEGNMGTSSHFGTFLKKVNMTQYLKKRKDLSGKGHVDTTKIGTYVTKDVRDWQMRQANSFLRTNCHVIGMEKLLRQMLLPVDKNADILDAWLMTFIAMPDNFWDAPVKKAVVRRPRQIRTLITEADGRVVEHWIDLP